MSSQALSANGILNWETLSNPVTLHQHTFSCRLHSYFYFSRIFVSFLWQQLFAIRFLHATQPPGFPSTVLTISYSTNFQICLQPTLRSQRLKAFMMLLYVLLLFFRHAQIFPSIQNRKTCKLLCKLLYTTSCGHAPTTATVLKKLSLKFKA